MEEEGAYILQVDEDDVESRSGSCRRRLLLLGRLLLHLGCLGYSLYLIWLLAYLKDNLYYWFLSLIPFFFYLPLLMMVIFKKSNTAIPGWNNVNILLRNIIVNLFPKFLHAPSAGVVITLMSCFTMLTRIAYYHRQPDEFIGPRFIIMSLQGSIILIFLDFCLQREGKLENLLNFKDALTRMLLDFVDIFNMVEILSELNECVEIGGESLVSENSSTERSIQAFCTISFVIVWFALDLMLPLDFHDDDDSDYSEQRRGEKLYMIVLSVSFMCQNFPFLVIRIVVCAQYNLYSLGFLTKNFIAIVLYIASVRKRICRKTVSSKAKPFRPY